MNFAFVGYRVLLGYDSVLLCVSAMSSSWKHLEPDLKVLQSGWWEEFSPGPVYAPGAFAGAPSQSLPRLGCSFSVLS